MTMFQMNNQERVLYTAIISSRRQLISYSGKSVGSYCIKHCSPPERCMHLTRKTHLAKPCLLA